MLRRATMTVAAIGVPLAAPMATVATMATAGLAQAQDASSTTQVVRAFVPFLGCWAQDGGAAVSPGGRDAAPMRCIVPGDTPLQLRLSDYVAGEPTSGEVFDASTTPIRVTDGGCSGTHRVAASEDGRRLYHEGDYTCTGDRKTTSKGLLALGHDGMLLDVREVSSGGNDVVQVRRLAPVPMGDRWPAAVLAQVGGSAKAIEAARADASAPLSVAQVSEVSAFLPLPVVERWLLARGEGLPMNAATLTRLADAGTPGPIVDVLVALAYPRVFNVDPDGRGEIALASRERSGGGYGAYGLNQGWGAQRFNALCNGYAGFNGWNSWGMMGWSPYAFFGGPGGCWDSYGLGLYGFWPFLYGNRPVFVGGTGGTTTPSTPVAVIPTVTSTRATRGRLVNGRGYVGSGGTAGSAPSRPVTSQSGGSYGGSSAGSSSGSSSSGGGGGRTAKPRDP